MTALGLALANWNIQKEPSDARLVLQAAVAADDPAAAAGVLAFLEKTGLADMRLKPLRDKIAEPYESLLVLFLRRPLLFQGRFSPPVASRRIAKAMGSCGRSCRTITSQARSSSRFVILIWLMPSMPTAMVTLPGGNCANESPNSHPWSSARY